jgi:hypothetical protein
VPRDAAALRRGSEPTGHPSSGSTQTCPAHGVNRLHEGLTGESFRMTPFARA